MEVDLHALAEQCAAEPIHFAGAIQPHGVLVSFTPGTWTVEHVSQNAAALFEQPAAQLLGRDLRDELPDELVRAIEDVAALMPLAQSAQRCSRSNVGPFGTVCDVLVHRTAGLVHLEFEPVLRHWINPSASALADGLIGRVANADGVGFFDACARQVRALTGFDRVMVYRFRHDDSGEVIAESRAPEATTYHGLRFPAFDIPAQARRLYVLNRIRAIPDATYAAVPLLSRSGAPLDLSHHALRSVAPVHLQYLANMGVAASLSVSIVCGDRLWGLIACHHSAPMFLDPGTRSALELFGRIVSMRLTAQQQEAALEEMNAVDYLGTAIAEALKRTRSFGEAVARWAEPVRRLFGADGLGVYVGGAWQGVTGGVDTEMLDAAAAWLQARRHEDVSAVDEASAWRSVDAPAWAGVLVLRVDAFTYLALFRREDRTTVTWAGAPAKTVEASGAMERLTPRASFAAWQETVRGRAAPWLPAELRKARRMVRDLREVRRQADQDFTVRDAAQFQVRQGQLDEARERLRELERLLATFPPVHLLAGHAITERVARFEADVRTLLMACGRVVERATGHGEDA
jgi:light-regulated signal transduction histidine kinase (bacteriophytochrome)